MKIVLIGAGSAQFGYGALGDVFATDVLAGAEIALVDINEGALDSVYRAGRDFIESRGLNFTLTASTDRNEVLAGADFVLISIEVGNRFELWDMDWKVPLQYGVSQVYGENGGPGGIFHALRITPPILAIVDDVVRLCPDAVVFNYSNPMTAITTAVLRKYPDLRFLGMCHEISSLERDLPGVLGTDFGNLELRSGGLNHFSVLVSARYRDSGKDAYPDILAGAPAYYENEPGFRDILEYYRKTGHAPSTEGATEKWDIGVEKGAGSWSDRYLFRAIVETYGLLPITTDSHLGEYISWAQDAADHRGILDFYEFYRKSLTAGDEMEINLHRHERATYIMEALVTGDSYEESAVNVMNKGYIRSLPDTVAVEVPAVIGKGGIEPVGFDDYPRGFGALLNAYSGVYDLTVEAVLRGSRDLVLQAVLASPTVGRYHGMAEMVDRMIDSQKRWLSYLK